ncbi:PadR family transcriptional regulator [Natrinema sp. 1APR25-10V2]|uniref:PadR family transcriptional regulator n=1 Tax=Natrinema sp. 1APR25-10V2 TaxID=2951081 RepID=UPI0028741F67|nr:PadR family transcriptional regulator [Natrinema sp. 1APR25-10V2]MDS0473418.1 PadR family transcriptional regulator [Natrinema sp. 1APR25-10V2]
MSDDELRDLEPPARAVASPATTDGRRAWIELTGFQRDCLEAVARRERDGVACTRSGIVETLERRYPRVSAARLEPNLRALVGRELLAKREADERATAYHLTGAGRALLIQRAERLAVLCDLRGSAGLEKAVARGEGDRSG